MDPENKTLGELLNDPRIAPVAENAIRARRLKEEPLWNMTPEEIKSERFLSGEIARGIQRLYEAAGDGDWLFPLYGEEECAENEDLRGVSIVRFASREAGADFRPFIFLVPGGGFVNVWNLTEGWPIAEQFNRYGYHVFILTYQVGGRERLLEKNMEDFSRALRLIGENEARFRVRGDRYITCGFSAGGYLVCLWNTGMGYRRFGLPGPEACFPVYPVVSLREGIRYGAEDDGEAKRLYGCSVREAAQKEYEIPEHAEGFPPSAVFLAADDGLVDPENSRLLCQALEKNGIPCRLEIGPSGGHGFADGTGTSMAGWTGRAVRWFESL